MVFTRRDMLTRSAAGLGSIGLAALFSDLSASDRRATTGSGRHLPAPHFLPKARRIIHLYMNGGPSHVDTFDHKPSLKKHAGERPDEIDKLKTENPTGGLGDYCRRHSRFGDTESRDLKSANFMSTRPSSRTTSASSTRCTPTSRTTNHRCS